MATGFYTWSKTPATNSTADTTINWAEGQSPSSVNDSSRAMMARLAEYRDDISGTLTTAGTSTAYTVATNQVFASLAVMNKSIITIVPHATSGASPTLAVDGLTAIAINYSTGSAVPSGSLKAGTPYALIYIHASTEFIVLGAFAALPPLAGPCPVGGVINFAGTSAPTGWLLCYGQSLLRTDYALLFTAIGTTYGAADGTHFSLPDCRGYVVAGKDDMGGSSANRLTAQTGGLNGDTLGATGGSETHTLTTAQLAVHGHDAGSLNINSGVPASGWSPAGSSLGSVPSGTLVVGSGASEISETLESLRRAADNLPLISSHTASVLGSTANTGSGTAHNNVQPTIILNKIIFAGV